MMDNFSLWNEFKSTQSTIIKKEIITIIRSVKLDAIFAETVLVTLLTKSPTKLGIPSDSKEPGGAPCGILLNSLSLMEV